MTTFTSVMKDIQTLSQADQRKIKVAMDTLVLDPKKDEAVDHEKYAKEALFYESLKRYLGDRHKQPMPPLGVFKSKSSKTDFNLSFSFVDEYIDKLMKGAVINRQDRGIFYDIYFRIMGDYLVGAEAFVSPKTLLSTYLNFPGLLDRSFPSYAKSGLMPKIIEAHKRKYS